MNERVIVVRRVAGRLYPETWPNTPPEVTARLRLHAHQLRCREGLSYRAVQTQMMERYGERRSLGQLHKDLTDYQCPRCSTVPKPPPPPDPAKKARAYAWR